MSLIRYGYIYQAIQEENEEHNYPIQALCRIGNVSRAGYYKWLKREETAEDKINRLLAERLEQLHREHPEMGYRRLNDELKYRDKIAVNDKRILRICRIQQIYSQIKHRYNGCSRAAKSPAYTAENLLNREFKAEKPNEKWVTDVTELKYGNTGNNAHKLYLSVILDLCDRRPVAYVISEQNDNKLVFDTFRKALAENPKVQPLVHSDRGFQYTNREFHSRLEKAGIKQSMSRIGHCTDNGVMEGFWGILKREMYYGRKYQTKEELVEALERYMEYYTNGRPQRGLGVRTPREYYEMMMAI